MKLDAPWLWTRNPDGRAGAWRGELRAVRVEGVGEDRALHFLVEWVKAFPLYLAVILRGLGKGSYTVVDWFTLRDPVRSWGLSALQIDGERSGGD